MLLAVAGFSSLSVGDAIVKTMAGEWSPLGVAALRFTIGAIGLALLLWRSEGTASFRPRRPLLQIARGFCLAGATLCFFSAIFVMQLAEAMAIAFISPIIVAFLSGPLLKEKVRPAVWIATPVALIGVLLVLRPNFAELGWMALLPLISAAFFGTMVIANRAAAGDGSSLSMQAYIACIAAPFLVAAALVGHLSGAPSLQLDLPDWTVVARCALVALTASSAHWLAYMGTMRAGAATIAPMVYVQMIVAVALGYLLFGDVPDLPTISGAAIIIGAGLFLWLTTPRTTKDVSRALQGQPEALEQGAQGKENGG
ncbi:DMT family transporter [Alteriqipengyuania lutimaris]|uniref:DMT family transporter n=1 Tax=Alteriqipengyuania lutimaris TaxID=1538146 RepID=UPI002279C6A8|nr:DMT family transporter [Alteriqipengyuania lutimaris]